MRVIYENLAVELEKTGRDKWLAEELGVLKDPQTYIVHPDNAWNRLKIRNTSGKYLAIVRELAKFREVYAQSRNVPRNRVYKDDALLELAATKPGNQEELGRSRLLLREARRGDIAEGILAAVSKGVACAPKDYPEKDMSREKMQVNPAIADLLRVLLKGKSEEYSVASKLIATASDLDAIAGGRRDVAALSGWRRDVFGEDALRLCKGEIALHVKGSQIETITV